MGKCFTTTNWRIKDGERDTFIDRWTAFLAWSRATHEGLEFVRLVADEADPLHFLSVGEWHDAAARQAWAEDPQFMEHFMPCFEACNDMQGDQFEVKVVI